MVNKKLLNIYRINIYEKYKDCIFSIETIKLYNIKIMINYLVLFYDTYKNITHNNI